MKMMTPQDFMKSAVESDVGYFLAFASEDEAKRFRMNCYTTRSRKRALNRQIYVEEPGYQPHSEFDALKFDIREEAGAWILIATSVDLQLEHTAHGELTEERLQELLGTSG